MRSLFAGFCACAMLIAGPAAYAAKKDKRASGPVAVAQSQIGKMEGVRGKVNKYLDDARKAKDVMRYNCLNGSMVAINGLIRLAKQAIPELQQAIEQKDEELTNHASLKIEISEQQSKKLLEEAESCVGDFAVYTGDTDVDTEISDEGQVQVDPFASDTVAPFEDDQDGESEPLADDGTLIGVPDSSEAGADDAVRPPSSTPFF